MVTKIISHRGRTSNKSPDNTLQSIKDAIEFNIDMVEFDVRRTRDGQIVCFHDAEIDDQLLISLSFSELTEMNSLIPTLEQVLQLAKGKIQVDVDLKETGYENEVINILLDYFEYTDFIMKSFNRQVIKRIKEIDSRVYTGLLMGEGWKMSQFVDVLKESFTGSSVIVDSADFLSPNYKIFEVGLMTKLSKMQIPIQVWTVNDEDLLKTLLRKDIHSIVTDIPERAMEFRESIQDV
jgi:glycerophosphoryl diester phosphodiesterase